MALVALLRGANVGGHRTFRPAALAKDLQHLGAVNIGAAGTFVFTQTANSAALRTELARRLPFETEIMVCQGREVVRLVSNAVLAPTSPQPDIVRFVSVLARAPRSAPRLPIALPHEGPWLLRVLAREGRFVVGEYRRHMKAVGYLGKLDQVFGVPATTRNWNTMTAIVAALHGRGATPHDGRATSR